MITKKDIICAKSKDHLLLQEGQTKLYFDYDSQYYTIYRGKKIINAVLDIDLAVAIFNVQTNAVRLRRDNSRIVSTKKIISKPSKKKKR